MFRVQREFEFTDPGLSALAPGSRQFHVVEQVFDVPLWIARVLPVRVREARSLDGTRRWTRYLATRFEAALGIVAAKQWEQSQLLVLIPGYMTNDDAPKLARCWALWECHAMDDEDHILVVRNPVWIVPGSEIWNRT